MARKRLNPPPSTVPAEIPKIEARRERRLAPELAEAWRSALTVTEADVANYIPTSLDATIAEALLAGALSPARVAEVTGRAEAEVRAVITDPVAMAYISRAMYAVIGHRLALVDAAMYTRAVSGDVQAAKLVYERVRALTSDKNINVKFSGGVNISALSDEDLRRILLDKERTLEAEYKVLPSKPVEEVPAGGA